MKELTPLIRSTLPARRVCVFCGSSTGHNGAYRELARGLGTELAARHIGLVYGGGQVGLMGVLANAVLAGGGHVIGVIPSFLSSHEVAHNGLPDLRVVDSMHERKAMMASLSDGFIVLPGGMGTLEEMCETLTWAQLGLHDKPCGLLDVDGYFDAFVAFLDRAVADGFVREAHRNLLTRASTPQQVLSQLTARWPAHREVVDERQV